jgi:hypothetical protein
MKKTILLGLAVCLSVSTFGQLKPDDDFKFGPYSLAEQALVDKGLIVETYMPDKPSGHMIGSISFPDGKDPNGSQQVVLVNFGKEDATVARAEGQSMATFQYSPQQAEQFLFAEGWDHYHDRFMTRAYVQEGLNAYNAAIK